MIASILTLGWLWLGATQSSPEDGQCNRAGPSIDQLAWYAHVPRNLQRAYFLKLRSENARCPADLAECAKRSYLIPGDRVLAWATEGDTVCALFSSDAGRTTVGRLPSGALDTDGVARKLAVDDWLGDWRRDAAADIKITRLDAERIDVSGFAEWGGNDPVRVANGSVHVGEIESTPVHVTGWRLRFVAGIGNTPPAREHGDACVVEMQWREDTLVVDDNFSCGGMNVSFSGIYRRTTP